MMFDPEKRTAQLSRMQAARRQTQHQLDLIDRQITRKMTALIPLLGRRHQGYRRGKALAPGAFLERYRANLAALTAERQPEVDALTRKLARQDAAIAALRSRHPQFWFSKDGGGKAPSGGHPA
ncbi:hypothetical protein [Rhizobium giardinii]|uniref:Uncharacterized protein n=1 Tax=Rhizobium giardinii TaxID=56731 RepID=A0A7W8UG72_9HYPH|nr:hypothetical protein [Rhizobium giardinii]MBB5538801.1 hypothetical protein [Rhizobium giardinii]